MQYNYFVELTAVAVMLVILCDYKKRMQIVHADARIFKCLLIVSCCTSCANVVSSILIQYADEIPVEYNIAAAVVFFMLQSIQIYLLMLFALSYSNPNLAVRSPLVLGFTVLNGINLLASVTSPLTHLYFYFDEQKNYCQGSGADLGYGFYFISVFLGILVIWESQKKLLQNEVKTAVSSFLLIGIGVFIQLMNRDLLLTGISMAAALLQIYFIMENPSDYIDKLTGCLNEFAFKQSTENKQKRNHIFTVVFFDVCKFRYVNSLYGMENGDYILRSIGIQLRATYLENTVFRIHNDLFALVFDKNDKEANQEIEVLQRRFQTPWRLEDGKPIILDAVIVVVEFPTYFHDHTTLIEFRNMLLDQAKHQQDHAVLYADAALAEKCQRKEAVEEAIHYALNKKTLEVHYQPICSSEDGTVVALEALSRLNDEKLGYVPPDEFIAVAESCGMIVQLGEYVFEEVCRFLSDKLLRSSKLSIEMVEVNLSLLQCIPRETVANYIAIMERHRIPPKLINLEITESSMFDTFELIDYTMQQLLKYGISFSLDDYGTGSSNISKLIQFPFSQIKFDKNMTQAYFTDPVARTIMQKEFEILQSLGKKIVVEGIETREQSEEMKRQNIQCQQGYYFSKAIPADECVEYIRNHSRIQ